MTIWIKFTFKFWQNFKCHFWHQFHTPLVVAIHIPNHTLNKNFLCSYIATNISSVNGSTFLSKTVLDGRLPEKALIAFKNLICSADFSCLFHFFKNSFFFCFPFIKASLCASTLETKISWCSPISLWEIAAGMMKSQGITSVPWWISWKKSVEHLFLHRLVILLRFSYVNP